MATDTMYKQTPDGLRALSGMEQWLAERKLAAQDDFASDLTVIVSTLDRSRVVAAFDRVVFRAIESREDAVRRVSGLVEVGLHMFENGWSLPVEGWRMLKAAPRKADVERKAHLLLMISEAEKELEALTAKGRGQ